MFKALRGDAYKVTIFGYSMTEIVKKWPQHDPTLAMMEERNVSPSCPELDVTVLS
jgi:hypothetical protein